VIDRDNSDEGSQLKIEDDEDVNKSNFQKIMKSLQLNKSPQALRKFTEQLSRERNQIDLSENCKDEEKDYEDLNEI